MNGGGFSLAIATVLWTLCSAPSASVYGDLSGGFGRFTACWRTSPMSLSMLLFELAICLDIVVFSVFVIKCVARIW